MSTKQDMRDEAIQSLLPDLPPGTVVYTILRHVARSGMTRWISPVVAMPVSDRRGTRNGIMDISWLVRHALDLPPIHRDHGGLKIGGCGMDMGFHLVYSLSRVLYPGGFDCIGEGCPSNDHSNRVERLHHPDGGYALRHTWL